MRLFDEDRLRHDGSCWICPAQRIFLRAKMNVVSSRVNFGFTARCDCVVLLCVKCGWERSCKQDVVAEPGDSVWSDCSASCCERLRSPNDGRTVLVGHARRHDADVDTDDVPQPSQEGRPVLSCSLWLSCWSNCDIATIPLGVTGVDMLSSTCNLVREKSCCDVPSGIWAYWW